MSLLGTLEQFRLPNVLQRLESHEKSGLLVVRQGVRWVEFYVRNGSLLCIGPVRTSATLGDRLLQDRIISQQVWQEVAGILGSEVQSETRVAITLMARGDVTREQLRAWVTEKSLMVLSAVLAWTSGEVYFEEDTQPPADRLLVSMSLTSLIETANVNIPSPQPERTQAAAPTPPTGRSHLPLRSASPAIAPALYTSTTMSTTSPLAFTKPAPVKSKVDIAHVPTLMEASQFLDGTASDVHGFLPETESSLASFFNGNNDPGTGASLPDTNEISFASLASVDGIAENPVLMQPEPVMYPNPPKRIDTSFMQPDMVLVPADLAALRESNPKVQVTPEQWRVLTCVDGQNSLQVACQLLGVSPDVMCMLAGELVAEGLIYIVPAEQVRVREPGTHARDLSVSGQANAYVAPGYAARGAAMPAVSSTDPSAGFSFETESQWGNGGNGATFIPGRGWITTPQPMQSLPSQGSLVSPGGVYAPALR